MLVLVFGATGLVGRAACRRLLGDGHRVIAWVRTPDAARTALGAEVELVDAGGGDAALAGALGRADAILNLAGESVLRRWNEAGRAAIEQSRVGLNRRIVAALQPLAKRPRVWVQASAIGYYGDRGDELLDESSSRGEGFLAELCEQWEASALAAAALGVRVACVRIGVVLAADGGALAQMLPTARLGLGAALGSGRQWLPWIHLADLVELLGFALADERCEGVLIGTAPAPVVQHEFARALGRALHRPVWPRWLGVPGFALRAGLGEAASAVLGSQRTAPTRALSLGFRFGFPDVDAALADVLR
jgi:uncharacterized protein